MEDDFPEEEPQEMTEPVDEPEDLVDSDAMSDAEGGFTQGAEGDINYFGEEDEAVALDDDERIED